MAETLGSLIDRLAIKSIREFYLHKMLKSKKAKFSRKQVNQKLRILRSQKELLLKEVEEFVSLAPQGRFPLRDDKLKLYNKPEAVGKIGRVNKLSRAIDALTKKNMQLWNLEDEARRQDVSLQYVGRIKKKIDFANQQRNDLIDKIDELLEERVKKYTRHKTRAK